MPTIFRQLDEVSLPGVLRRSMLTVMICSWKGYEDLRAVVLERSKLIFSEDDSIGSGEFGVVYKARLVDNTAPEIVVAVKKLFPPSDSNLASRLHSVCVRLLGSRREADILMQEVLAKVNRWSAFSHMNILRITGYYPATPTLSGEILLAFPYVSSGNLTAHLDREYTRKISLNNVFVMPDGHAVLGDYDLGGLTVGDPSRTTPPPEEWKRYQSPEQFIKASGLSISSDIWAFGCIFLKIITGRLPYQDTSDTELTDALHKEILLAPVDDLDCPPRAQNLLGICWRWAPEARPPIGEIAAILTGRLCKFEQAWSIPVNGTVQCLRFSHDSKYLVVGFDAHIRTYESENGCLVCELSVPSQPLWVQMSRSGKLLAASFKVRRSEKADPSIRLWDLETQELIATYEGHTDETWALDISPDDTFVASGSYDRTVHVWPIGGEDTKPLTSHKTDEDVAFLNIHGPLPATVVSLWRDEVQLMDIIKGTAIATLDRLGKRDSYWTLRLSSDSQRLYGAANRGGVCFWEVGDLLQHTNAPKEDRHLEYNKLMDLGGDDALAITASKSWLVYISRSGSVGAMNLRSPSSSPETIGTVNSVTNSEELFLILLLSIDPTVDALLLANQADMTQVTEDGTGLVLTCPRESQNLIVYRYQPWDKPGVWKS
ncbi:hypothetical protein FRB99_001358 [Tulasnella sp. 403]|nr:hypothetical protein FRB99_001358 [Tulasnella sp. 403]